MRGAPTFLATQPQKCPSPAPRCRAIRGTDPKYRHRGSEAVDEHHSTVNVALPDRGNVGLLEGHSFSRVIVLR